MTDSPPSPETLAEWSARVAAMHSGAQPVDEIALLEGACAAFLAALDGPGLPAALHGRALGVFARMGAVEAIERLWATHQADPTWESDGLLLALPRVKSRQDRLDLLERHRAWGADLEARAARDPIRPAAPRKRGEPIRLGFISSDLRNHVVGLFTLPVFKHLDPRFELYAYSGSPAPSDAVRDYMAGRSRFRMLGRRTPREAAQMVADDGLDILIELSGHTHADLPPLLAYRPAPIQVSWLGYPHSLGLSTVDHILVDPRLAPAPELRLEAALSLPSSWVSYYRPLFNDDQPIEPAPPAERNGFITFGTMNAPLKYGLDMLRVWARVVATTPGSRFLFVRPEARSAGFRRSMQAAFSLEGVAPERVLFDPLSGFHMPGYNRIDITLDTFPLTGGATTLDSMWMGVPVVSLHGPALFERLSHSLLGAVGEPGLSVGSVEDYVALALALARDPVRRRRLRDQLRGRILASPLGDAKRFAAEFYDAMEGLVSRAPA